VRFGDALILGLVWGHVPCFVAWLIGLFRPQDSAALAWSAPGLGLLLSGGLFFTLFLPSNAFNNFGNGEWMMGLPFLAGIGAVFSLVMLAITLITHIFRRKRKGI